MTTSLRSFLKDIESTDDLEKLEELRVKILGKKGILTQELKKLGGLEPEKRKEVGAEINAIKEEYMAALQAKKALLETVALEAELHANPIDVTLPSLPLRTGKTHPVPKVIEEIAHIFGRLGFSIAEGPDIENDFNNFTALNVPDHHPARQMHDTFYLPDRDGQTTLLRTHTSTVQIRTMTSQKPPIKIIAPGKTYRSDSDQTHTPMFHQIEGLYVAEEATFSQLKGCLVEFLKTFFNVPDLPVRFRPSYFPFTEPSAEVDIGCARSKDGVTIGAGEDWLEILGCGMVHPNVLKNCDIDPTKYKGYAFGMGVERMAMLKYGAPDLRAFFEANPKWSDQYGFNPF